MPMKKWRKALLILCALTLFLACLTIGFNLLVCRTTAAAIMPLQSLPQADCILVLGCGVMQDGTPSTMLRDRLDTAIEAFQAGAADRLLMSGDHGRADYDEVNAMKDYAIARGVPSEKIFMDHAGFSTYESMVRAREIFQCQCVIVVTQTYHLYRAIYDARAMGMEAVGLSATRRTYGRQRWFDLREAAARVKDVAWCFLRPSPAFLGEAIPIFGNGDVTNDR